MIDTNTNDNIDTNTIIPAKIDTNTIIHAKYDVNLTKWGRGRKEGEGETVGKRRKRRWAREKGRAR